MSLIVKYYCFLIILGSLQSTMHICCCYGMTVSSSSKSSKSSISLESMFESGLLVQPLPNLYILGTVHIGSKSAEEVEYLIEKIQPSHIILEIPPSRLQQKQKLQQQKQILSPTAKQQQQQNRRRNNLWQSLGILPDLAYGGYMNGGLSGMLFTTTIVGSSLIKLSMTSKQDELPRRNEFEAAIDAVLIRNNENDEVNNIIGADLKFDNLIQKVSKSMTLEAWIRLAILTIQQIFGIMEKDPIQRQQNESMLEWEIRRRNINTARSSCIYSQKYIPKLHQVLVVDRDIEFARYCLLNNNVLNDDGDDVDVDENHNHHTKNNTVDDDIRKKVVICIVGLVHLDGIVDNIILSS